MANHRQLWDEFEYIVVLGGICDVKEKGRGISAFWFIPHAPHHTQPLSLPQPPPVPPPPPAFTPLDPHHE